MDTTMTTMTTHPEPGPLPERMAMLRLTPEALAALLQLPEGSYIDAAETRVDVPDMVYLRVRGAGYEVRAGELIPHAPAATVRMLSDGENRWPVIDWRLPADDHQVERIGEADGIKKTPVPGHTLHGGGTSADFPPVLFAVSHENEDVLLTVFGDPSPSSIRLAPTLAESLSDLLTQPRRSA